MSRPILGLPSDSSQWSKRAERSFGQDIAAQAKVVGNSSPLLKASPNRSLFIFPRSDPSLSTWAATSSGSNGTLGQSELIPDIT